MRKKRQSDQMRFLVEISSGQPVEAVTASLKDLGVQVKRVMPRLGIIDAHGPAEKFKEIRGVPGVEMVREQGLFQLPPFDERIPQ